MAAKRVCGACGARRVVCAVGDNVIHRMPTMFDTPMSPRWFADADACCHAPPCCLTQPMPMTPTNRGGVKKCYAPYVVVADANGVFMMPYAASLPVRR